MCFKAYLLNHMLDLRNMFVLNEQSSINLTIPLAQEPRMMLHFRHPERNGSVQHMYYTAHLQQRILEYQFESTYILARRPRADPPCPKVVRAQAPEYINRP